MELGLSIRPDGYVPLHEVMEVKSIKCKGISMNLLYKEQRTTFEEIKDVVENNDKKRYQLSAEVDASGKEVWWIRAV